MQIEVKIDPSCAEPKVVIVADSMSEEVQNPNSEIINLKKVKSFDLSFAGTVCVEFLNGTVTYVSRRYVPKIKKILGV